MKSNKRLLVPLGVAVISFVMAYMFNCYYHNKTNASAVNSGDVQSIILNVLNNDSDFTNDGSHLSNDEFSTVQKYVKEHEKELKDYNPKQISNKYSIVIDRETRALCVKNGYDMTRRLTWRTIDCNNYSDYYKFVIQNDRTYCIRKNVIAEYYLGQEIAKYEVPVENPVILSYYMDDVIITDENPENTTLVLCTKKNCIPISDSFSQLPVEIYGKGLYYIDNNLKLYMYNLCTGKTTYIAADVYNIFRSSGINFKSKDGIFRINQYVSESGDEQCSNIKSEKTDKTIEKWTKE